MIQPRHRTAPFTFALLAALLAGFTAGFSLLNFGLYSGAVPDRYLAGTAAQDAVTVVVSLALLATLAALPLGWAAGWPVLLGLLSFLFYGYAVYAFEATYTLLFPAYTSIIGLALAAMVLTLMRADPGRLTFPHAAPPRVLTALLLLGLSAGFVWLWSQLLIPALETGTRGDFANSVITLDFAIFLPLNVVVAGLLLLRRPFGDLLGPALMIKLAALGGSVLLGTLLAPLFNRAIPWAEAGIYAAMCLLPAAVVWPWLSRLAIPPAEA